MGLDAAVSCTCYRQGRAISPFPKHTRVDDEGELFLDLPLRGHEDEHDIFEEWLYNGSPCEHPRMELCQVRISNWGGVSSFKSALEQAGWEHFPTLHTYLPNANGGHLPADAAGTALEELETFRRIFEGSVPVLVNAETGDLARPMGNFIAGGHTPSGFHYAVGLDQDGVYVAELSDPPRVYFRSRLFELQLAPGQDDLPLARRQVVYRDVATGEECLCPIALLLPIRPITLRVEQRGLDVDYFTYIFEPLEQVLQASMLTGNPVRWC